MWHFSRWNRGGAGDIWVPEWPTRCVNTLIKKKDCFLYLPLLFHLFSSQRGRQIISCYSEWKLIAYCVEYRLCELMYSAFIHRLEWIARLLAGTRTPHSFHFLLSHLSLWRGSVLWLRGANTQHRSSADLINHFRFLKKPTSNLRWSPAA